MIFNVGGGELVESNIVWSFMLSHVGSQNQEGTYNNAKKTNWTEGMEDETKKKKRGACQNCETQFKFASRKWVLEWRRWITVWRIYQPQRKT